MGLQRFDKRKTVVCNGNTAAAIGVMLSRPDVIAIYPITPQTAISEEVSRYHAEGFYAGELVEVEGENSAMGVLVGASASGGRTFTATSSWGLVFMYDGMMMAAGQRLPIVMVNVNRETPHYMSVSVSRQDIMSVRDAGWIHIEAESCQEILDSVMFAYRLSEDPAISLPTVVSYDGFYLSHLSEKVEVPSRQEANRFLGVSSEPERPRMDSEVPMSFFTSCTGFGGLLTEYRYQHARALDNVLSRFDPLRAEFEMCFDREYDGPVTAYDIDDAEYALISMGSGTGAARVAIKKKRAEGIRVGLLRLKLFQPFPAEILARYLRGKRGIGILERSVAFQQMGGHLLPSVRSLDLGKDVHIQDFIVGLGSLDVTPPTIEKIIDIMIGPHSDSGDRNVFWMDLEGAPIERK